MAADRISHSRSPPGGHWSLFYSHSGEIGNTLLLQGRARLLYCKYTVYFLCVGSLSCKNRVVILVFMAKRHNENLKWQYVRMIELTVLTEFVLVTSVAKIQYKTCSRNSVIIYKSAIYHNTCNTI